MKSAFFLLIISFLSTSVFGIEVFVWKQTPEATPVIFPLKDGQNPEEVIRDYYKKIHDKKSVRPLLGQVEIQDLLVDGELKFKKGSFFKLENESGKPRFIVVTNELRELYAPPYSKRSINVINRLKGFGAEAFVLPVMHDLTLNAIEAKEYRKELIKLFDAQLVLGGADIDPYLYGEVQTHARDVIRRRDVSELKFVRQFVEAKEGMNFGICRGHQMCAVANHKKLIQDIQIEENASEIHLNGEHLIDIDNKSEIFSIFDQNKIMVNSLHHQAVVVPDGDNEYKVIATSLDQNPIVEAVAFKNGKGVTLQFHPELMFDKTGDKILKKFIQMTVQNKKSQKGSMSCTDLIKALIKNY